MVLLMYLRFTLAISAIFPIFLGYISPSLAFTLSVTAPLTSNHLRFSVAPLHSSADGSEIDTPTKKVPWEFNRFISQSARFISPPSLPSVLGLEGRASATAPGSVLWSSSSASSERFSLFSWAPLDDVVMGGASKSAINGSSGVWSGTVTDANSGGFVGIRTLPLRGMVRSLDMSKCTGIEIGISGLNDGRKRRFKFVMRDSTDFNGVCWTTSFDIAPSAFASILGSVGKKDGNAKTKYGSATTFRIPFEQQIPTIFSKRVPGKVFDKSNVVGMQLVYSKFEYDGDLNPNFSLGSFEIKIEDIKVY